MQQQSKVPGDRIVNRIEEIVVDAHAFVKETEKNIFAVKIVNIDNLKDQGEVVAQYYTWPKNKGGFFVLTDKTWVIPVEQIISILPTPSVQTTVGGRQKFFFTVLEYLLPEAYRNQWTFLGVSHAAYIFQDSVYLFVIDG